MNEWKGDERRRREVRAEDNQDRDHDLLISIHTLVEAMNETFKVHVVSDKEDFEKVHKRINKLSWYAAVGAGAVFALEFFKEKIFK